MLESANELSSAHFAAFASHVDRESEKSVKTNQRYLHLKDRSPFRASLIGST